MRTKTETHLVKNYLLVFLLVSSNLSFAVEGVDTENGEELSKGNIPSKVFKESPLSPKRLEKIAEQKNKAIVKENTTVKKMYSGIEFLRIRSLETAFLIGSGTTEDKPHFSSVSGFNAGMNVEFPFLTGFLNGGTPIAKARMGKTTIEIDEDQSDLDVGEDLGGFVDALGSSELYTFGLGGGYCYHSGFNCLYALYNSSFTGQLTLQEDGVIRSTPTKLKGVTLGMSSTFDVGLGIELTAGMEYSMMDHFIPTQDDHKFNTIGLVLGMGFNDTSRYKSSRKIKYVEPS